MSQVLKPRKGYKFVKGLFGKFDEIPESWVMEKFSKHSKIVVGHVGSTSEHYTEKGILFLRTTNVKKNIPDLTNVKFITREFHEQLKKSQITSGDILISRVGIVGIAYLIPENFPEANCANVLILKAKKSLVPKFLCYLLNSKIVSHQVQAKEAGGVQSVMNSHTLEKMSIPIPSIPEQEKIASILSNVDNLINSTQKIIDQTITLKKGLMQKLLTKGIGHKKFKKVKWLFGKEIEIPEEWKYVKLIEKCSGKPEYGAGISAIEKNLKLPRYIRITDLNNDGSLRNSEWKSISEKDSKGYILNEGDILFARTGATVGKTYLHRKNNYKYAFAGYLIRFKPDDQNLDCEFLFNLTHSKFYWSWLTSIQTWGVQPNVNAEQYSNMPILLPPLPEQQKIASILSGVDAYIQKSQEYKEKLDILKGGLMQKLLTGEVRVKV